MPNADQHLHQAPFWLVLWNTVRAGGALHPVREHPLVSQQIEQSGLDLANYQRHTTHCNVRKLSADVGFVSDRRLFPRCVDGPKCNTVLVDGV